MNLKTFAYAVRKEQATLSKNIYVGKISFRENGYEQIAKFNINHFQISLISKKSSSFMRHLTMKVTLNNDLKLYKQYTYTKYNQMIQENLTQIKKDLSVII